jgi:hypothetical protein
MSKRTISVTEFTCDSCGKTYFIPKGEVLEYGWTGMVRDASCGLQAEFFACSPECLPDAPNKALLKEGDRR